MENAGDSDLYSPEALTVLRGATPADYPAIAAMVPTREELFLVYPSGEYPLTIAQLSALARERRELTVAVRDERVAAFANLYGVEPGRRAFIGNVVVSNAFRGAGLGRMLVGHMIRLGFEKYGMAEMAISVFSHNLPALLLYASLGFRPYAVEERRTPQGERCALIHMVLPQTGDAGPTPQEKENHSVR